MMPGQIQAGNRLVRAFLLDEVVSAADAKHAAPLIEILKQAGQKPPKELRQMAKLMKGGGTGATEPTHTVYEPRSGPHGQLYG